MKIVYAISLLHKILKKLMYPRRFTITNTIHYIFPKAPYCIKCLPDDFHVSPFYLRRRFMGKNHDDSFLFEEALAKYFDA